MATFSLSRTPFLIHEDPTIPCSRAKPSQVTPPTKKKSTSRGVWFLGRIFGQKSQTSEHEDDDDEEENLSHEQLNEKRVSESLESYIVSQKNIVQIECKYNETYMLMNDGVVFYCHFTPSSTSQTDPIELCLVMLHPKLFGYEPVKKLFGGYTRMFFLVESGDVYVQNDDNTYQQCGPQKDVRGYYKMPPLDAHQDGKVTQVACSYSFSLFLVNNSQLFIHGQNWVLPSSPSQSPFRVPLELDEDEHITTLTSGSFHNMVLTNKGRLFSMGEKGEKTIAHQAYSSTLIDMGEPVALVKCKYDYSVVVTESYQVYIFGLGSIPINEHFVTPPRFPSLIDSCKVVMRDCPPVVDIAMSRKVVYLITRDRIVAIGNNDNLQLNLGSNKFDAQFAPHPVVVSNCPAPPNTDQMCYVGCGEHHAALFLKRGSSSNGALLFMRNLRNAQARNFYTDCSFSFYH